MEKIYCVYAHINKVNNKVYIGQTKSIQERWKVSAYENCTKFYNALQKYGWDGFEHKVLFNNLTLKEANKLETEMIIYYNSVEQGYNLNYGGDNRSCISDETRNKLSQKSLELWNNKEYQEKQRAARIKSWDNEERRQAASDRMKEKMSSVEIQQQQSEQWKGSKNPRARKVVCLNTGQVFDTIKEAEVFYGFSKRSNITAVCKGLKISSGKDPKTKEKLRWAYYEDYIKKEKSNV